jgi:hypothetical protein
MLKRGNLSEFHRIPTQRMMIQITKLLHNPQSIKVLSFLVGMGLTVLLCHKPIEQTETLALSLEEIEGKVVSVNGKCYSYHAEDSQCEISVSK